MDHRTGFGLLFLGGGLMGVAGGWELVRKKRRVLKRIRPIKVRIVEVERSPGGDDPDSYTAVVEYTVDGDKLRTKLEPSTLDAKKYRRGKSLDAYYDPENRTDIALRPRDFPGGLTGVVLGVIFTLIGGGLLYAASVDPRK
jgi:hypothetical protein